MFISEQRPGVSKLPILLHLLAGLAILVLGTTAAIAAGPSTTTLQSSPNASGYGKPVTLTATVSPSSATGRVTFFDGVTILGDAPGISGTAQINSILLTAG